MSEWNDFWNDLMAKPETPQRAIIEVRAAAKKYHDFESDVAAPKMTLRADLLAAGYKDMADKVIQGDYDF